MAWCVSVLQLSKITWRACWREIILKDISKAKTLHCRFISVATWILLLPHHFRLPVASPESIYYDGGNGCERTLHWSLCHSHQNNHWTSFSDATSSELWHQNSFFFFQMDIIMEISCSRPVSASATQSQDLPRCKQCNSTMCACCCWFECPAGSCNTKCTRGN